MRLSDNPSSQPENFYEKAEELRELKRRDTGLYFMEITQLQDMAVGGDGEGKRSSQYPGWESKDFEMLIDELGESLYADYEEY